MRNSVCSPPPLPPWLSLSHSCCCCALPLTKTNHFFIFTLKTRKWSSLCELVHMITLNSHLNNLLCLAATCCPLNSTIRPSIQIALSKCVRSEKSFLFAFRRTLCVIFKETVHPKWKGYCCSCCSVFLFIYYFCGAQKDYFEESLHG